MDYYLKNYFLNSLFHFISIIFIIYSFFNIEFLEGNNIDEFSNNYCQTNPSSLICKNKYKKHKFIWIFLDGNAYDQLYLLQNKTKYKIPIIFRGKGNGYKHTNQLFTEMFSGVPSRNMGCKEIKTDQIFKQLHKSGYKMHFLGINEPVNKLNGENNLEIFTKKNIFKKHEKCSFCSFCNITYPISDAWCEKYYKTIIDSDQRLLENVTKEQLYKDLDYHFKVENNDIMKNIDLSECFKKTFLEFNEEESLIYYNTEIDEYNHLLSKDHIKTITEEYNTENWVIKIMEWIDEHPDYALIVNSDHGGQKFYGEDDINNHGFDDEGNEAILFLYSKELKEKFDILKNDNIFYTKVDPSSIISQILENVNIPLQSQGIAYPIGNDPLLRYTAYKSKEIQLINLCNTYIKKYPKYKNDLDKIIDKIKNSKYYKINDNNYQNYFNKAFTRYAIEFNKLIQNEIINIIKDKNKYIFSHIILFIIIFVIYLCPIIFHINELYLNVKSEGINKILFFSVLVISLFIIPLINFFFIFVSVYNRLVLGILLTPFCLFISNIIIKKYLSNSFNIFDISNIIILLLGIMSIIVHYLKFFIYIKKLFSKIIYSRIFNVIFLYPILYLELYYEIKRHFYNKNILIVKYTIYNVMIIISIIFIILLILFDMSTGNYFFTHTPFNYTITILIYILFIILIFISIQIIVFNNNQNIENNFGLIKLIIFLFEFYINDESNRLFLLLIYIILEFFSNIYYKTGEKKINQIIISIIIININEIFYLITHRVYSLETSKKFFSKTITYSIENSSLFKTILTIFYKMRFPFITGTYFLNMTPVINNILFNIDSFILRIVLNIKCYLNFLFFIYQFIFLKNDNDFMTIMIYLVIDFAVFLFDFINIFLYRLFFSKKGKSFFFTIKDDLKNN